ncbi:DHA2 family efflux MFS transporter permease subunit [Nocardia testacea]|uniref:DHA2 family efflux MFS transporter permease subunit n=1 Tax=Nocardia testacea TaxID=248551 RepID=A0ABW7VTL3_9NOCA
MISGPAVIAPRRENLALAVACLGSFVVILDATIVSVALPDIRAGLGFSTTTLPWVVNAYTLAFAGFLLFGGRCGDVLGGRWTFVLGMSVFSLARLLAGSSTDAQWLLIMRAIQGLGGALLMPVTLTILTTTFPEPGPRARALGLWSAVGATGAAGGPVIGGLLTEWSNWRWVFFVTVPIGVVAAALAWHVIPSGKSSETNRIDVIGALLATSGSVAVVYAVMRCAGPDIGTAVAFLAIGGVLLALFVLHQAYWAVDPLLPLSIFRLGSVAGGNGVMLLLGLGFFASPILLSLYMQDVMGFGPLQAGIGCLPVGVAMVVGARVAGPCTARWGPGRVTVVCCLGGALGFLAVAAALGVDRPYIWAVGVPGLVLGMGSAAAFTPVTVAATADVPAAVQGTAAGMLNATRQLSGAVGLAALSAAATAATERAGGPTDLSALAHGYAVAFAIAAGCLTAAAVTAAIVLPRPERQAHRVRARGGPRLERESELE